MAADDFTLMPTWVFPKEPEYHNVITPSESMKKEYLNISSIPILRYRLKFDGMSDADFETLRDHYIGRLGGYDNFDWKNAYIPAYIIALEDLGAGDLNGRWVQGSFRSTPFANHWDVEIVFEKAN